MRRFSRAHLGRAATVLFVAVGLSAAYRPAQAAGGPPCERPVRFAAAWFPDPEVDNGKSASELTRLGSGVSGTGTQLGHVMVETQLKVVPQTSCAGLVVRLDYAKPVLRIAREMVPGSCAYARVMNHEQTHVRIHREIAQQFRELDYPWVQGTGVETILASAKLELDRLMQAQVRFDSPEEYARNHTACGGEILRLVGPGGPPGAAGRPGQSAPTGTPPGRAANTPPGSAQTAPRTAG